MPRFFSKGFKPQSTTRQAKQLIRGEIESYYPKSGEGGRIHHETGATGIDLMKADADAYNSGRPSSVSLSDWEKGAGLVDSGSFRVYHDDQADFLGKIYGKENVGKWSGKKIHNTYRSLIGREYAAMLREKKK